MEKEQTALVERTLRAAERYLSYRPQSMRELEQKLARHGYDAESIAAVLARLKEAGLVDDTAFARFWQENRQGFRPRSRRLLEQELKRKGVAEETIRQSLESLDDDESAYRAALGRARRWPPTDEADFRRRLVEYLRRRGFDYEVIRRTTKRLGEEGLSLGKIKPPPE